MTENMTVLVTGASGTLGAAVVPRLEKEGYRVRPMSRRARPGWVAADLRTGEGLAEAVEGIDVIVHLASAPGRPQQTDVEGTRLLLTEARHAGVRHVLYVSINGIDRVPYRYYQAKLDTEEVVKASGVPVHDPAGRPVPPVRRDAAGDGQQGRPGGHRPDLAGPAGGAGRRREPDRRPDRGAPDRRDHRVRRTRRC